MKQQLLWIAATTAFVPLSFIHAPYPQELVLQHVGTLICLGMLFGYVLFAGPTHLSVLCALGFLWLHMVGARWIYSYVPYDQWILWMFDTSLSDQFGWKRNHYDRLVHFASGFFGVPLASEFLQRFAAMRPMGAAITGIMSVMSMGAFYEIIEWQMAVFFSPAQADAYNGQQGDVWDPQKDMAMAAIGAVISAGLVFRWRPRSLNGRFQKDVRGGSDKEAIARL